MRKALILVLLVAGPVFAEPPSDKQVDEQIRRLETKDQPEVRREAAKWLATNAASKNTLKAIPKLEELLRGDSNWEVRVDAAAALGRIAKRHELACPVALVEAMWDKEDNVRWMAMSHAGLFKRFADGSIESLLRVMKSERPDVRSDGVMFLAIVGPKDVKALAAIEAAKNDKVFNVRHSAHCAKFTATANIEEFLRYMIRLRETPDEMVDKLPPGSEEANRQLTMRNLCQIGMAVRLIEWSEKNADEFAAALLKCLADDSAVMRRGAATIVGASARKTVLPAMNKLDSTLPHLLPYLHDQLKEPVKPDESNPTIEPSQVMRRLEKSKVDDLLKKLGESDPDRSVRDAAWAAISRYATVRAAVK